MTNPPLPQPGQPGPFPGSDTPAAGTKPTKPWFKRWWVWVLAVIVLGILGSALGGGQRSAAPAPSSTKPAVEVSAPTSSMPSSAQATQAEPEPSTERLTLEKGWKVDKSNQYAIFVTGYVRNNSAEPIDNYVQITFDVLDKSGANAGTCLANTNTIDAGGRWKFKALCSGEPKEVGKIRFKEITGF
jgi:hypothetical protein